MSPVVQLLTPEEIAERTKLNVVTIRRLCQRGTLPAHKLAGQWRVDPADYDEWLAKAKERTPAGVVEPIRRRARVSHSLPFGRDVSLRAIAGGRK